jgi:hypothetical protein
MNLQELLDAKKTDIITEAQAALARARVSGYERAGEAETSRRLTALFDLTRHAVGERNLAPIVAHAEKIARERFEAGVDLSEVQTAFNVLEESIWMRILKELSPAGRAEALGMISTVLGAGKDALARTYVSLATKTKTPSLNLQSLFHGASGS